MTESVTIKVPIGMSKYLNCANPETELIKNAQTISHGRAAEILEIKKSNHTAEIIKKK